MEPLTETRQGLLEWIAEEFLHNSWAGRRLVAVEGAEDAQAARFADDFAAVLAEGRRSPKLAGSLQ